METSDNAIALRRVTRRPPALPAGLALGALGVLAFSFSFPATKLAVGGLNPWFVAFGRASVAALLAAATLAATRAPLVGREHLGRLAIVAAGVVVGFPLFSSLALTTSGSAHGAVVIAVLPAATALVAVARAGERPGAVFWLAASAGLAVVVAFTIAAAHGAVTASDAFLLVGTALCAAGYAEGGVLARDLGGARTICWALVIAAPVTVPVAVLAGVLAPPHAGAAAWEGFGYVSAVSMFLGFFAWYAGLARGGVARVGQVQLLQPLLTVAWSAAVLGEHVGTGTVLVAVVVLACVVTTQRARVRAAT
jgi:drug/metabolite transporter (DMT)-like permease